MFEIEGVSVDVNDFGYWQGPIIQPDIPEEQRRKYNEEFERENKDIDKRQK